MQLTKKQRRQRRIAWLLIAVAFVIWLLPRRLVPHPDDSEVFSILYRADDWEAPCFYYPSEWGAIEIDEEGILQLLHQYKAFR